MDLSLLQMNDGMESGNNNFEHTNFENNNIVSLKQANIYQGNTLVLNNVNLEVNKGEFIYMIGKTGTGKSSLLKTMYGDLYLKEG